MAEMDSVGSEMLSVSFSDIAKKMIASLWTMSRVSVKPCAHRCEKRRDKEERAAEGSGEQSQIL
jgi:hypothetical protein